MSERDGSTPETHTVAGLSEHGMAFFRTLARHMDTPVNKTDLTEEHPELDWTGQVNDAWRQLNSVESLSDRLFAFGEGSNRVYALTSHPDDLDLVVERLRYIAEYSQKTGAPERETKMWGKRIAAASAIMGAIAAGTAAIVVHKRRKHG